MYENIVSQWYENKTNVDEMLHWNEGMLNNWEEAVTHSFLQNGRVLDIGCGLGREAFALYKRGFSIVGIDISQEVIRQVTLLSIEKGYDIPFLCYDGKVLPFANNSFDTIIIWSQTFGLLYGDIYKNSFLRECYRVLKTDGILSFSGHDHQYVIANYNQYVDGRKFYPYTNSQIYWETFLPKELSDYAQNAGFAVSFCERGKIYRPEDGVVLHCLCRK